MSVSTQGAAHLIDQAVKPVKRPPVFEKRPPIKQTAGANSNVQTAKPVNRRPVVKPRR